MSWRMPKHWKRRRRTWGGYEYVRPHPNECAQSLTDHIWVFKHAGEVALRWLGWDYSRNRFRTMREAVDFAEARIQEEAERWAEATQ